MFGGPGHLLLTEFQAAEFKFNRLREEKAPQPVKGIKTDRGAMPAEPPDGRKWRPASNRRCAGAVVSDLGQNRGSSSLDRAAPSPGSFQECDALQTVIRHGLLGYSRGMFDLAKPNHSIRVFSFFSNSRRHLHWPRQSQSLVGHDQLVLPLCYTRPSNSPWGHAADASAMYLSAGREDFERGPTVTHLAAIGLAWDRFC
jgi:hypothetical protein